MANDKQELIDQFHKNSIELVEINLNEWKYQLYVDIRIWTLEKPSDPGNVKPSHKGLTLNVDLLSRLIRALEKAQARVKAKAETGSEPGEKMHKKPPEARSGQGRG